MAVHAIYEVVGSPTVPSILKACTMHLIFRMLLVFQDA